MRPADPAVRRRSTISASFSFGSCCKDDPWFRQIGRVAPKSRVSCAHMNEHGPTELSRLLLAEGRHGELLDQLARTNDQLESIIAGSLWLVARDRTDKALASLGGGASTGTSESDRVRSAMAAVLTQDSVNDELAERLLPSAHEQIDPWGMVAALEFCDYVEAYDAAAQWRTSLLEVLEGHPLSDNEDAICRAHAACSLVRSALALAPEMAIRTATAGLAMIFDAVPAGHPRRIEYFAALAAAAAVPRHGAFMFVFAEAAHRESAELPAGNERILRMVEAVWDAANHPTSVELGAGIRVIAARNEALGFFARRGQDLYSCMARQSTAADLLGALTRGDSTWLHPSVGLRVETGSDDTVRLVLSATHPEADDFAADLNSEDVGTLLAFASSQDLPVRRFVGVGRNDPCPCGSGKKFKRCCGAA